MNLRVVTLPLSGADAALLSSLEGCRLCSPDPNHFAMASLREHGFRIELFEGTIGSEEFVLILPPPASSVDRLIAIVDRLLGPGGCPWDQAQTHDSLKKYLLEEAYEVIDAIDSGSAAELREELGDLLLQPVLHGQISSCAGGFDTFDVADAIVEKLIRRHPHVFGDVSVSDADEVLRNWDRIKQGEKEGDRSILAGVPRSMPALHRAYEVSKRAVRVGFEWPSVEGVWEKVAEEEQELRAALSGGDRLEIESELGDLLFTLVNLGRWAGVDPEEALRRMVDRFTSRFECMERLSPKPLGELSLAEWDALWEQAKAAKARGME